jgi:hypothetical protein
MLSLVVLAAVVLAGWDASAGGDSGSSPHAVRPRRRDISAIALVRGTGALEANALVAEYKRQWKGDVHVLSAKADDVQLDVRDAVAEVSVVRERLPVRTAGTLIAASWQWSGAAEAVDGHRAQVMIKMRANHDDPVEDSLRLARMVSVVVKSMDTAAVFWPSAAMLIEPGTFVAMSSTATGSRVPTRLFVNLLPGQMKDGTAVVHTVGLRAFEMPEVILAGEGRSDEMSLQLVSAVCDYILGHRLSLRDGDTLRMTETDVLKADEIQAPWDPKEVAIRLRGVQ